MRDDEWNDSADSGAPIGHHRRPRPDDRRRANGTPANGVRSNGTHRLNGAHHELPVRPLPVDDADDPIDLVAVQADDELLSALASGLTVSSPGRGGYDTDDKLVQMLAAWREEVDADPVPDLVDTDAAIAAVVSGQETGPRRKAFGGRVGGRRTARVRFLAPVAAAACMVVLSTGAVAAANVDSRDDLAFPIVKVVDSEKAESLEAKAEVEEGIQRVRTALAAGDTDTAAQEMQQIQSQLPKVGEAQGQTQLVTEQKFLETKLQQSQPGVPVDLSPASTSTSPVPSATTSGVTGSVVPSAGSVAPVAPVVPGSGAATSGSEEPEPSAPGSPLPSSPVDVRGVDPRTLRATDEPAPSTSAPSSPTSSAPGTEPDPTGPTEPGTGASTGAGTPGPTSSAGVPPAAPAPGTASGPTDDTATTTAAGSTVGSAGANEKVTVTTTTTG